MSRQTFLELVRKVYDSIEYFLLFPILLDSQHHHPLSIFIVEVN